MPLVPRAGLLELDCTPRRCRSNQDFSLLAHAIRMNRIYLNCQNPQFGISVVNFRNYFVSISTWLAFAGVILAGFRAFAAGEDAEKSPPTELTIAAAADLRFALDDLVKDFEEKYPATKINVTYGSSGNFFAQFQNGAPFDLFFSADVAYPRKLAEKGLGADDVFLYAIGCIVVWVPKDSPVAVDKLGIKALLEPSIRKIAVANPEHAPYGRAAVAALKALNVYDQVASRLVYGENIAQTAQFVQSGAADVGILALSLAVAPQMRDAGRFWQVPLDAYPRMEQGGIILKSAKNLETARAFRDFVLGDHGREVLKQYGFYLPEK
jgi:molybdate transport system substrate-binding protein